jgi:LacI family transcriptional regulator
MATSQTNKVTISDVAAACGLAKSTVSNALADKPMVRAKTKMLVRHVAEQLGYRVSSLARGLRMGKTWSVAMIVPDITNPFHGEVVRGAEEVLTGSDYYLYVANTDGNRKKQTQYVNHFIDRQVDGMILMSHASDDNDMRTLIDAEVPTVLLVRRHSEVKLDFCGIENEQSMNAALGHLWSLGHRRIGFISGPPTFSGAFERLLSYRKFMERKVGTSAPELIDHGEYSIESGRAAALRLLKRSPAPTALMVAEDMMALGALNAANELGLVVPEQLSVVGWDDLILAGLPQVNLTTMQVPKWQLGGTAAKLLIRRINMPDADIETRLVRPQLIVRGTSGAVGAA